MPHPYLRTTERKPTQPERFVGVLVITPTKKRYLFPGGNPDIALILVHDALPDTIVNDPRTVIEFGEAFGSTWLCSKVLKAAVQHGTNTQ